MFASTLKMTRQREADLRADAALVAKQLEVIASTAIRDKRAMTDAERRDFLALTERRDRLRDEQIENDRALRQAEDQNEAERRGEAPISGDAEASLAAARRAGLRLPAAEAAQPARPTGRRFADMFPQAAGDLAGWTSGAEYLQCVAFGRHDGRLRADTMSGDTPSLGGFLIPSALYGQVLDSAIESEIVRPRASVFPMTSRELDVPAWDDLDRTDGAVGNVSLQFIGESGTLTPQVAKLRTIKLRARKGALFVEAPNELVQDAPNFSDNLTRLLARALSFGFDREFLFGAGANGPLGALVAPCTVTVTRASAGAVLYEDLTAMFARLTPGSVTRSIWIANPSTIPQLASLSVIVGTGGSHVPVMTQADGQFYILTRPVIFSEKVPALGQQSDISLADFAQYAVGLRREAALDRSQHVGFARDVETFRLIARMDGQPIPSGPITPTNGDTLSPFVTLS